MADVFRAPLLQRQLNEDILSAFSPLALYALPRLALPAEGSEMWSHTTDQVTVRLYTSCNDTVMLGHKNRLRIRSSRYVFMVSVLVSKILRKLSVLTVWCSYSWRLAESD